MKTMQDYTIYCTEEQTRRAYKLGAPILQQNPHLNLLGAPITEIGQTKDEYGNKTGVYYNNPTTQQMIGWLREKGIIVLVVLIYYDVYSAMVAPVEMREFYATNVRATINFDTYEQAELAGIDAALDYLEKGGKV